MTDPEVAPYEVKVELISGTTITFRRWDPESALAIAQDEARKRRAWGDQGTVRIRVDGTDVVVWTIGATPSTPSDA